MYDLIINSAATNYFLQAAKNITQTSVLHTHVFI